MKYCGHDGLESLALNFPLCCDRHKKETMEYMRKSHDSLMKNMISVKF